jgi:hypothetical protein
MGNALTGFTLKSNPLPSERSGRGSRSALCLVGVGDVLGLGMYDAEAAVVTRINTVSSSHCKGFINEYVPMSMCSGGERRAKDGNLDKKEIRGRTEFEKRAPLLHLHMICQVFGHPSQQSISSSSSHALWIVKGSHLYHPIYRISIQPMDTPCKGPHDFIQTQQDTVRHLK